jgi:hypothetical protein
MILGRTPYLTLPVVGVAQEILPSSAHAHGLSHRSCAYWQYHHVVGGGEISSPEKTTQTIEVKYTNTKKQEGCVPALKYEKMCITVSVGNSSKQDEPSAGGYHRAVAHCYHLHTPETPCNHPLPHFRHLHLRLGG